jgi:glucose-6-phosphate 1-dehydrogenase
MRKLKPDNNPLSIVVVGASGDLARKKTFPALFALFSQGFLPDNTNIFGFARSEMDDATFREHITANLTCRYVPGEDCAGKMRDFLKRCFYVRGQYNSKDSFDALLEQMRVIEGDVDANRLFYMAIPPSVFTDVAHAIGAAGMIRCGICDPWSRIVIEKPFGRDRASSDAMVNEMAQVFSEAQTYRIDHYLGKEVIQNLLILRFANIVFGPLWNCEFIRGVEILWKEDIGTASRGGYFDQYGIIRDVVQNHLLQIVASVAMEPPAYLNSASIAAEKARVLRAVPPPQLEDCILGQYGASERHGRTYPGYVDDPTVPNDSISPTFAAVRLQIDNPRWEGVPFLIYAGKGVDAKMTEIHIHFHPVPGDMFCGENGCPEANQLTIRVQPDEGIYLSLVNKVPGMGVKLASKNLDLRFKKAFKELIPDAYETLLLDVIEGDHSLFIQSHELEAAWDIFTPLLHEIERRKIEPERYPFGSQGPRSAERFRL